MKTIYYIIIFLLLGFIKPIYAQLNLIQNSSMEDYKMQHPPFPVPYCPTVDSFPYQLKWYDPNGASSDWMTYVNTLLCPSHPYPGVPQNIFGWQWPKDGDAYWHFGFSYHETAIDTHTGNMCNLHYWIL